MGDIAEDILAGGQCEWCGICFQERHGHPVLCISCWEDSSVQERKGHVLAYLPEN